MAKPITMTYSLAMAAGQDAGNRSMRRAGRSKWDESDWNAAAETFARLWGKGNQTVKEDDDDQVQTTIGEGGNLRAR